jgi:hypothetical protein
MSHSNGDRVSWLSANHSSLAVCSLRAATSHFGRSTTSRRIVVIPAERWIHADGCYLVRDGVPATRGAAKPTPISHTDRVVNFRRAKEHGAETDPMVGFQIADHAAAEEAAQLDAHHHPA